MSEDEQLVQIPSTKPELLKLRLVTTASGGIDRYALIPCPKTYKEAQILAIEVFQRYMEDPTPNNIIIRCAVTDKKGDWLWADIRPSDWKTVIEKFGQEVGVFPLQPWNTVLPEYSFQRGSIFVTFGTTNGHKTTWTVINSISHLVDRPKSYEEAIEYITNFKSRDLWDFPNVDLTGKDVTFYTFMSSSTDRWEELPPLARTDDRVWRALVPAPGEILGFKIKTKS
ncbi:hypothetical protein APHAL10511_007407 [Amanita phalloides]|nr:hypothetical protein APHAL10511_007407 [Amanita phalloides]